MRRHGWACVAQEYPVVEGHPQFGCGDLVFLGGIQTATPRLLVVETKTWARTASARLRLRRWRRAQRQAQFYGHAIRQALCGRATSSVTVEAAAWSAEHGIFRVQPRAATVQQRDLLARARQHRRRLRVDVSYVTQQRLKQAQARRSRSRQAA